MKIKSSLRATLLSATALVLTACGEAKEEALTYNSVESCISAGVKDANTCRVEFQKARELHNQVAPRYARQNECYSDFGYNRCQRTSSGFWLPFMVGYMIAPRLSSGVYPQPLYRTTSNPNSYTTASNGRIGSVARDGRTQVAKSCLSWLSFSNFVVEPHNNYARDQSEQMAFKRDKASNRENAP